MAVDGCDLHSYVDVTSKNGNVTCYLLSDSVSVSFADGSANLLVGGVKQSEFKPPNQTTRAE